MIQCDGSVFSYLWLFILFGAYKTSFAVIYNGTFVFLVHSEDQILSIVFFLYVRFKKKNNKNILCCFVYLTNVNVSYSLLAAVTKDTDKLAGGNVFCTSLV